MSKKSMMMNVVAGALFCTLALAGCGGSQPASNSSNADSGTETSATQTQTETTSETTTKDQATSDAAAAQSTTETAAPAPQAQAPAQDAYIGNDAAKAAALAHAGVNEASCTEMGVELDTDDGTVHYDVDFKSGGMEYEYDINAVTGEVMSHKSEIDD